MSIDAMNRLKANEALIKQLQDRVQKLEIDYAYLEAKEVIKRPGRPRKDSQLDA